MNAITVKDTFIWKAAMKKHMAEAHDVKTQRYSLCNKKFVFKKELKDHNSIIHRGKSDPLECSLFHKKFIIKAKLYEYISSVHIEKLSHR